MNKPSIDPADEGTLVGAFKHIFNKMMQNTDGMLPATVIRYDRGSNRATVQPSVKIVTTEGKTVSRATIASVPVYQIGGGGYMVSFPIQSGDKGWIFAGDRDISLFMQGEEESTPNTNRKKSFSDGLFLPDAIFGHTVSGENAGNMTIQNKAGDLFISLSGDTIKIKATNIEFESSTLKHNGVNIGATHVHGGVSAGSSDTEVPK